MTTGTTVIGTFNDVSAGGLEFNTIGFNETRSAMWELPVIFASVLVGTAGTRRADATVDRNKVLFVCLVFNVVVEVTDRATPVGTTYRLGMLGILVASVDFSGISVNRYMGLDPTGSLA